MKKLILALMMLGGVVFADSAFDEKVAKLVSEKVGDGVKVVKTYDFKSTQAVKFVLLEDTQSKTKVPVFVTSDAKILLGLSNIFIPTDPQDLTLVADLYQQIQGEVKPPEPKELDKFFSSLKQNRYITLKSSNKKSNQTTYMVSDPRCPSCHRKLGEIEESLKKGDVKLLLVAFLGPESAQKAALIQEKLIGVKDNATKLKIIREIYDPEYKLDAKAKKLDISGIEKNNEDVGKVGIRGVPFEHIIKK